MKRRSKIILGGIVLSLIVAFAALSYSPTMAIRMHLFTYRPLEALTCNLEKSSYIDPVCGQQYGVDDCGSIYFAYVKQNPLGMYYWSGGGSGP